jgi:hypothetical protein
MVFCSNSIVAQNTIPQRKNVFSFNLLTIPGVHYERFISERQSFGLGVNCTFFPLYTGAVNCIADYRFHIAPKKVGEHNDTKDAFFGPFVKYVYRSPELANDLTPDMIHQFGFGIFFGVQNISKKGFVMGILGGLGPSVLMIDDKKTETFFDDPSSLLFRLSLYIGFAK